MTRTICNNPVALALTLPVVTVKGLGPFSPPAQDAVLLAGLGVPCEKPLSAQSTSTAAEDAPAPLLTSEKLSCEFSEAEYCAADSVMVPGDSAGSLAVVLTVRFVGALGTYVVGITLIVAMFIVR